MKFSKTAGENIIEVGANTRGYWLRLNGIWPTNIYDLEEYGRTGEASDWFKQAYLTTELKPLFDWACAKLVSEEFVVARRKLVEDYKASIAPENTQFPAILIDGSYAALGMARIKPGCDFIPFKASLKINPQLARCLAAQAKAEGCKVLDCYGGSYGYQLTEEQYDRALAAAQAETETEERAKIAQEIEEIELELSSYSLLYQTPEEAAEARQRYNVTANEGGDGYIPRSYYQDAKTYKYLSDQLAMLKSKLDE